MHCKVHRVRYYNPKPQPINCASFNKHRKILAIARGDASIEIWDLNHAPYLLKFIPGVKNGSVEAVGWVHERLLTTGLGGALVEWDLDKLSMKNTVLLTGYAAWCLDVNSANTLVAVGTEQGYINLYNVENEDIVYQKLFDKQEGRIMCCKFDKTGNVLVTGSINTIRVWNVETGHATSRISVSRRGKTTIVWSLAVLSDNIVVSGESHGRLTFWDSAVGDQIESYVIHKADILSVVVSDDETNLYCSGVDPVITNFVKVEKGVGKQSELHWVKNIQRNIHEHDVRALVINGDQLVSLGVDGYLTLSSYPPKWVMRIPPMIPAPRSSVCTKKKLLLLRYSNHLEVWRLGSYVTNDDGAVVFASNQKENPNQKESNTQIEQDSTIAVINKASMENKYNQMLKLSENPLKLVSVTSKGKKQIRCCGLSPSGEFIVYSTDSHIRMLKLETDDDQSNTLLSKVPISGLSSTCSYVAFTDDSRWMAAYCAGSVHVLHLDPDAGATLHHTISTAKYLKSTSILHLTISNTATNDTYLIVADTQGAIAIWTRTPKKFEHYATLPKYRCVPSAITIDNERQKLIIVYVDQKVVEYDLMEKKVSEWAEKWLPTEWAARCAAVVDVSVRPHDGTVTFHDQTSLWLLKTRENVSSEPLAKKKTHEEYYSDSAFRIIPIKYLAGFHWISKDEAVMLEILPENIVLQLPPVMAKRNNRL